MKKATLDKHPLLLVDFYAEWCEPCKMLDGILEEVQSNMNDKIFIQKINVDNKAAFAKKHSVMSVPVLILFKNGDPVWRMNGFMMAPELLKIFEKYI